MNSEKLMNANKLIEKIQKLKEGIFNLRSNIAEDWRESTSDSHIRLTKEEEMSILERAEKELAEAEAEFSAM